MVIEDEPEVDFTLDIGKNASQIKLKPLLVVLYTNLGFKHSRPDKGS